MQPTLEKPPKSSNQIIMESCLLMVAGVIVTGVLVYGGIRAYNAYFPPKPEIQKVKKPPGVF